MASIPRVFLSHSSIDKPIFNRLFERVDSAKVWLDSHELELGDALPAEISQALDESGAFVILLSKHSLESNWVKYELNMALIKYLESVKYRIIVVRIDYSDTPLSLKPFLRIDQPDNTDKAIDELSEFINSGEIWGEDHGHSDRLLFVNRGEEKQCIEDFANEGIRIILLSGAFGFGKTSLAVNVSSSVFGRPELLFRLTAAHQPKRLALELAARAKIDLPNPENGEQEDIDYALYAISHIQKGGRILIFDDVDNLLNESNQLSPGFLSLLRGTLSLPTNIPLILTSARKVDIPIDIQSSWRRIHVERLTDRHISFILGKYAQKIRPNSPKWQEEELLPLSKELHGYPLAAALAADLLADYGPRELTRDLGRIKQLRVDLAHHLLGRTKIKLSNEATRILEVLSISDMGLSAEQIAETLSLTPEDIQKYFDELSHHYLIEFDGFKIRPFAIVKDTFWRSLFNNDRFIDYVRSLAKYSQSVLNSKGISEDEYAFHAVNAYRFLMLSGQRVTAEKLKYQLTGEMRVVAEQLHFSRRYKESIGISERWLKIDPQDDEIRYLLARSFTRTDQIPEATNQFEILKSRNFRPYKVNHGLGLLHKHIGKTPEAVSYFEAALADRPNYLPSLRDLAECYDNDNDPKKALSVIKKAYELNKSDRYVLPKYVDLLEKTGSPDEAKKVIETAVLTFPDEAVFHHRYSIILSKSGDDDNAYKEANTAHQLDPELPEIAIRLAKMEADIGDIDRAQKLVRGVKKGSLSWSGKRVFQTVEAALLRRRGSYFEARNILASIKSPDDYIVIEISKTYRSEFQDNLSKGDINGAKTALLSGINVIEGYISTNENNTYIQRELEKMERFLDTISN